MKVVTAALLVSGVMVFQGAYNAPSAEATHCSTWTYVDTHDRTRAVFAKAQWTCQYTAKTARLRLYKVSSNGWTLKKDTGYMTNCDDTTCYYSTGYVDYSSGYWCARFNWFTHNTWQEMRRCRSL